MQPPAMLSLLSPSREAQLAGAIWFVGPGSINIVVELYGNRCQGGVSFDSRPMGGWESSDTQLVRVVGEYGSWMFDGGWTTGGRDESAGVVLGEGGLLQTATPRSSSKDDLGAV